MTGHIFLIGFMGAGKTEVGRRLAPLLNRAFVDLDQAVEARARRPVAEIFASNGEAAFRRLETQEMKRLARRSPLVVAAGGGVIEAEENRRIMKDAGRVVFLDVSFDRAVERLGPDAAAVRPLLKDPGQARALFDRRQPLYHQADLVVSADGPDPDGLARSVAGQLHPDQTIDVRLGEATRPATATLNGPAVLAPLIAGRRVFFLTDRNVHAAQKDRLGPLFREATVHRAPPGESAKRLSHAQKVFQALLDGGFDRGDLLVAAGGGVVTDLGAFVAATYKRGMEFMLLSTTLLGCVDAAVGGKAAVNLSAAKNAVGCFTVPRAVVLDAGALPTLPQAHIRAGLIEAYKTGLVADAHLAGAVEENLPAALKKDLPALMELIGRSAKAKAEVVGGDFTESGRRAVLNLGHTYGHAVETASGYRVGHGAAVAAGMLVAAALSHKRGLLSEEGRGRLVEVVKRVYPKPPAMPDAADAWEIMRHDKKIRGGRPAFILIEAPGRPVIVHDLQKKELAAAVDAARRAYGQQLW